MLSSAFPGIVFEDEEEDEEDAVYFHLFDTNKDIYDIYKVARNFRVEYTLCENILLRLIEEKGLVFSDALQKVAFLDGAYLDMVIEKPIVNDKD